jgi:hypothetical protein
MELEKLNKKVKCDLPNCSNYADYSLKLRKFWNIGNTNLCKSCLSKLHEQTAKILTPKSPKNILKDPKIFSEEKII